MIRAHTPDDAAAFLTLRREALLGEPLSFAATPESDFARTIEAIRDYFNRGVLFGAFDGAQLVGVVGLYRDWHPKTAHNAIVWGTYVQPPHRGRGIGRELMEAAIAHARTLGVDNVRLSVSDSAPAARRLYERLGFRLWGTQPDALRHGDVRMAEHRLVLYV